MSGAYDNSCVYCLAGGLIIDSETPLPHVAYACRCEVGQRVPSFVTRWKGPLVRVIPPPNEILNNKSTQTIVTDFLNAGAQS